MPRKLSAPELLDFHEEAVTVAQNIRREDDDFNHQTSVESLDYRKLHLKGSQLVKISLAATGQIDIPSLTVCRIL